MLWFSDLEMPFLNGIEITRDLRKTHSSARHRDLFRRERRGDCLMRPDRLARWVRFQKRVSLMMWWRLSNVPARGVPFVSSPF